MTTSAVSRSHKNFINGEWVDARRGGTFENRNPANSGELVGIFPSSTAEDVNDAVDAAKAAFKNWRLFPAPRRAEILYRTAETLVKRKEEMARDMTREMGKPLSETRGDVQEAIDMTYYMAGEGRRLFGQTVPSELPNKFAMSVRDPLGVVGMITPWNFPMAIPSWKIMPALICGNTVVIKPAEDTPLSTYNLVQILIESGLPAGVLNIVAGMGPDAGAPLIANPGVDGRELHGIDGDGAHSEPGLRAHLQAVPPRNGRQEHHDRDGRRQPGTCRGRRGVGRLRNERAALHGGQPRCRAHENLPGISESLCGADARAQIGRWARCQIRMSGRW